MRDAFILAGDALLDPARVRGVDLSELDALRVTLRHDDGVAVAEGIQAIEALMLLKPSALEGRRLRWAKNAWAVHNLIGHPLMQLLAFLRLHRLAMRVHDGTVPRPKES
ncbi:MAG TPA: hypothetical protein VL426_06410 [Candidatus Binatia bacterium]|jgi:hypothetical protein|nr:hypothetical protein [Candidatus Binatia bacterium]